MSRFYFGDSDDSGSDLNDDSNLPFPKPLTRSSFLTPDFDPATFLASLANRHQTLGDLQAELRDLSHSLNKELLDLVNENYQDFLSLGTALKGGEEKVEEVRVGLLGFQRDVRAIREKYETRAGDVKTLLDEKKELRSNIAVGHDLLDINDCVEELEESLMITGAHKATTTNGQEKRNGASLDDDDEDVDVLFESESEESDDEDVTDGSDDGTPVISLRKLERHVQRHLYAKTVIGRVGETHPFVASLDERISNIRTAILLDLKAALKQAEAEASGKKRDERLLLVTQLYGLMGEEPETAAAALKSLKI
ncbi:hypothetical protein AJ80_01123 [Polytolypa hystricis UAMH7299]|uniref:Conserved oligomeric Golgi complex subunit 2 n=1 Tax=Polytolypa hystricis (strain UAMH7299) TaxID=1447883 RepID=A0A2B7YZQ4_POLH7|nr:hypothetical protein AJ80_01123 [Polytolypa hystricis UAMH7299]